MTKFQCLFISKNESLKVLFDYANKIPVLSIVCKPVNSREAQHYLKEFDIDILFCDAAAIDEDMEKFLIQHGQKICVIIVASDGEIANKDLPYAVFSFLNKPISLDSFLSILSRVQIYLNTGIINQVIIKADFVFIKSAYKFYKVKFSEILFCEGMKDYTQVHLINREKPIITLQNLKTFVAKLPVDQFIRIHRSFVVSLNNIDVVSKSEMTIGKRILPIGESYREHLFNIIQQSS
ncbi:MAG: LytTR family transcriptional regulator DNA-binding domain-containing protein [Sphingobacteriales bacterium]|nr:LytTR family transcriptional regulator DNA-binding domain-containing protein [Sphingobacteriales bacterium]